eukprot:GHVL01032837.1.p1 GENE.GHVL01032837.1~~GHVL01032837.1.p1  ORF type:complete len:703 (+),score=95.23 GHVL01032837.1:315-2423(+)
MNKPTVDSFYVAAGWHNSTCPFECPDGYPPLDQNPNCYAPLEFFFHFFGGFPVLVVLASVVVVFVIVSLACRSVSNRRRLLKLTSQHPLIRGIDEPLSDRLVLCRDDLPHHFLRIYLTGCNTYQSPWGLGPEPSPLLAPHVNEEKYQLFAAKLSQLCRWSFIEALILRILRVVYLPLAWSFLQIWRGHRARCLLDLSISLESFDLVFWKSIRARTFSFRMKFGCDAFCTTGYLDILDYDRTLYNWDCKPALPMVLKAAGDGSFCNFFHLDMNDPLVASLAYSIGDPECDALISCFNRLARLVTFRRVKPILRLGNVLNQISRRWFEKNNIIVNAAILIIKTKVSQGCTRLEPPQISCISLVPSTVSSPDPNIAIRPPPNHPGGLCHQSSNLSAMGQSDEPDHRSPPGVSQPEGESTERNYNIKFFDALCNSGNMFLDSVSDDLSDPSTLMTHCDERIDYSLALIVTDVTDTEPVKLRFLSSPAANQTSATIINHDRFQRHCDSEGVETLIEGSKQPLVDGRPFHTSKRSWRSILLQKMLEPMRYLLSNQQPAMNRVASLIFVVSALLLNGLLDVFRLWLYYTMSPAILLPVALVLPPMTQIATMAIGLIWILVSMESWGRIFVCTVFLSICNSLLCTIVALLIVGNLSSFMGVIMECMLTVLTKALLCYIGNIYIANLEEQADPFTRDTQHECVQHILAEEE